MGCRACRPRHPRRGSGFSPTRTLQDGEIAGSDSSPTHSASGQILRKSPQQECANPPRSGRLSKSKALRVWTRIRRNPKPTHASALSRRGRETAAASKGLRRRSHLDRDHEAPRPHPSRAKPAPLPTRGQTSHRGSRTRIELRSGRSQSTGSGNIDRLPSASTKNRSRQAHVLSHCPG